MRRVRISIAAVIILFPVLSRAQFTKVTTSGLPKFANGDALWVDVNNNGKLDLIASGTSNASGSLLTDIYSNVDGQGTFLVLNTGFVQVSESALATADVDHDGFMDILIIGKDAGGQRHSKLYKNNGNETFTLMPLSMAGVSHGDAAFADFNNDGWDDIVILGRDDSNNKITKVLLNKKNFLFESIVTTLTSISNGHLVTADFNKDGWMDVIANGVKADGSIVTEWYTNDRQGNFIKSNVSLPTFSGGILEAVDYNQDGYSDLIISGYNQDAAPVWQTILLKNNHGATFIADGTLANYTDGSASCADYNNDGQFDIAVTGADFPHYYTTLYKNDVGSFVDSSYPFPGIINGNLAWADYNGDNKIDLLVSGLPEGSSTPIGNLYQSGEAVANTVPNAPINLVAHPQDNSVTLKWDATTDAQTLSSGLSYSLYIGSASGSDNIMSSASNLTSGIRKLVTNGRWQTTEAFIQDLPDGKYYWSVQAIDPSTGSSVFAPEQSFIICQQLSLGNDLSICLNNHTALSIGTSGDIVTWYNVGISSPITTGNNLELSITTNRTIAATVSRPLGCVVKDTVNITMIPLPVINLGGDQSLCVGKHLLLNTGATGDLVQWYDGHNALLLNNSLTFDLTVARDSTIKAKVTSVQGCKNENSIIIHALSLPAKELPSNVAVCFGETLNLAINHATHVDWFSKKSGSLLANSLSLEYKTPKTSDIIWATVKNSNGCVANDTVKLSILTLPEADAGREHLICKGELVSLGATKADVTYAWSTNKTTIFSSEPAPVVTPSVTTTYYLTITDKKNCKQSDSTKVILNPVSVIDPGNNRSICIGSSTTLGGNPTANGSLIPYSYEWSSAQSLDNATTANPIAKPIETTTYHVIIRTHNCIVDTAHITVVVNPLPSITISPDVTIGSGGQTPLLSTGGVKYDWFPAAGLNTPSISNPIASPQTSTLYYLTVTDVNGCQSIDSVNVFVKTEVFVPNLFSPNGDGNNDTFKIFGTGLKLLHLNIYNSQGILLFQTSTTQETVAEWDGKSNGIDQPMGNYIWIIDGKFMDGNRITYKGKNSGTITLIR